MLPDDGVVDRSLAYQQFSLQIGRLSDETGGSETIRICFLCVHVPFSVHYFVPFPVDYRTSGDTDLESLRIVRHQRDCHESAIAPSMYTDSVSIHERKTLQHFDSNHLVLHFALSALAVDCFLIFGAPVLSAPVVLDIDNVPLLGHKHLPHPDLSEPAVLNHLGMRSSIDVQYHRIFDGRVEIGRKEEPVPVVVVAVRASDLAEEYLSGLVVTERIAGRLDVTDQFAVRRPQVSASRNIEAAVAVDELAAVLVQ